MQSIGLTNIYFLYFRFILISFERLHTSIDLKTFKHNYIEIIKTHPPS